MSTNPLLDPLARRSLTHQVADRIQRWIAESDLQPGERLPAERELAERLQVSRPAVREALRLLEGLGSLEIRHGSGTYLKQRLVVALAETAPVTNADRLRLLRQSSAVRALVDAEVAAQAALHATGDYLERIAACIAEAETDESVLASRHRLDLRFETVLAEASHNPYLAALQRTAHEMFRATWESCGVMPRPIERRTEHHRAIFEAVRAHRADQARALMTEHVRFSGVLALPESRSARVWPGAPSIPSTRPSHKPRNAN